MKVASLSSLELQEHIWADQLNTSVLMEGQLLNKILHHCTRWTKKLVRNWKIQQAKACRVTKDQRAHDLTTLCFQLQHCPQDHSIQLLFQDLEHLIQEDELAKAQLCQQCMHDNWLQDGERCSQHFFQALQSQSRENCILEICTKMESSIPQLTVLVRWSWPSFKKSQHWYHLPLMNPQFLGSGFWTDSQILLALSSRHRWRYALHVAEIYEAMKAMPPRKLWALMVFLQTDSTCCSTTLLFLYLEIYTTMCAHMARFWRNFLMVILC